MKTEPIELLAPAGNMESLKAAVSMGCDAVYLGGRRFNARAGAENFTEIELEEAVDYCHIRGVKVFAAVNTLYRDNELNQVLHLVEALYTMGADAFILQDLGLARLTRLYFPEARLHASTQMTAHSLGDVLFLKNAGFSRVVLSRELSLAEIREITAQAAGMEIEVFIHGALCVCYSGQCLMSVMIGDRSGNRGNCAGPCRQRYALIKKDSHEKESLIKDGYLLSPRDLMGLDFVRELEAAGVSSLKIEGRMRAPEYVAQAVRSYRLALDCGNEGLLAEAKDKLVNIFNRGGSSTAGYLRDKVGPEMMSVDTPKATGEYIGLVEAYDTGTGFCRIRLAGKQVIPGDGIEIWTKATGPNCGTYINKPAERHLVTVKIHGNLSPGDKVYRTYDKALRDELKAACRDSRKLMVEAGVTAKKDLPITLSLRKGDIELSCRGSLVEKADTRPVAASEIIGRLMKTGATPFVLSFTETEIEDDIFIDIKELNRLRREALEQFEKKWVASFKREETSRRFCETDKSEEARPRGVKRISALVRTREQYTAALEKSVDRLYIEGFHRFSQLELAGHFAALPRIDRTGPETAIAFLEQTGIEGYLVRTWGQLDCLRHTKKIVALDYSLPVFNRATQAYLRDFCRTHCLSPELGPEEVCGLADEDTELIIYGRLPAMVTRLCPIGNYAGKRLGCGCDEKNTGGDYFLRDKTGAEFPVLRDCQSCICFILNSRPLSMPGRMGEACKTAAGFVRLEFTTEDGPLTGQILDGVHKNV